jgi:hypothetical protein
MNEDDFIIPVRISSYVLDELKKEVINSKDNIQVLLKQILYDIENIESKTICSACGQDVIRKKTDLFGEIGD